MFNKIKKNNKGFTLVELLVVIAIIGILAVVAVPSIFKQINRANAAEVINYISSAKTAAISEYASNQQGATYTKADMDELISDSTDKIDALKVTVTATGEVTIVVQITDTNLQQEVDAQADASFSDGVTIQTGAIS